MSDLLIVYNEGQDVFKMSVDWKKLCVSVFFRVLLCSFGRRLDLTKVEFAQNLEEIIIAILIMQDIGTCVPIHSSNVIKLLDYLMFHGPRNVGENVV